MSTREASESLGFSRLQTFCYVVLPLAFRVSLPALNNNLVNLVKTTTQRMSCARAGGRAVVGGRCGSRRRRSPTRWGSTRFHVARIDQGAAHAEPEIPREAGAAVRRRGHQGVAGLLARHAERELAALVRGHGVILWNGRWITGHDLADGSRRRAMRAFTTIPNPDLTIRTAERAVWNSPDTRRFGFHNLHRISRHGIRLRARNVLPLTKDFDMRIEAMPAVQRLTRTSMFSAMAVVRDARLLYERYAADFGPTRPHAIMSISKTMMHLIYGQLVDAGLVDLNATVKTYLPEIGSGYAGASVRDVLDMNVANDYSEDYSDPHTSALEQEVSMGWRVPGPGEPEISNQTFLCGIESDDLENRSDAIDYKSANTDVLGWIAERVSGRRLYDYLVEIAEAAGLEDSLYVSTDRGGTPVLNGGVSLTARDLARYGGSSPGTASEWKAR